MNDDAQRRSSQDRRALAEAYQDAVQQRGGRTSKPVAPPQGAWIGKAVMAVLLTALLVWLLVAPPAWLRPPAVSPDKAEASARLALYLQAQRIDRFRSDSGHLPSDLTRVGAILPDIQYRPTGQGDYQLILGKPRLVYYSAASPESFLGGSMDILNGKGGREE